MCPDDSAVDHLHSIADAALGKSIKHQVPQAAERPATILLMRRVPIAEFFGKITPGRTGTGNPKHRVECSPMV